MIYGISPNEICMRQTLSGYLKNPFPSMSMPTHGWVIASLTNFSRSVEVVIDL